MSPRHYNNNHNHINNICKNCDLLNTQVKQKDGLLTLKNEKIAELQDNLIKAQQELLQLFRLLTPAQAQQQQQQQQQQKQKQQQQQQQQQQQNLLAVEEIEKQSWLPPQQKQSTTVEDIKQLLQQQPEPQQQLHPRQQQQQRIPAEHLRKTLRQHPSRSNLQENLPPKPPTQKHNLPPPISPQQFNFLSFGNNQGSSDDNSDSSDDSTTDNSDILADNLIDLNVNEDEWIYPEQQKLDNRAFVGNLLHTIPKSRLESTLEEQFGSVVEIDCIYNKRCAFVTFANKTSYDTAIEKGFFFIEGIKLSICMAKTKKRNPSFIKKAE